MNKKILGITDEITSCDCCGRSDLKKTVVIQDDDGNINYYGTVCAGNIMGYFGTDKTIKKQVENEVKKSKSELIKQIRNYYDKSPEYKGIYLTRVLLRDNPNMDRIKAKREIEALEDQARTNIKEKFGSLLRAYKLNLRDIIYI